MTIAEPVAGLDWSGFPFPFTADEYRYSTNVEPARRPVETPLGQWGDTVLAIDESYLTELAERAAILAKDPSRHVVLPHMRHACWDACLTLLHELATAYPQHCVLTARGAGRWHWRNGLTGDDLEFVYGDDATLPAPPLKWVSSQVQEDIVLLDQREQLYGDAGVVTFAADWSMAFDVGMSFLEIHGPVPRIRDAGIITRAHEFLLRLQPHAPYRRTNWTMTIGRRLDVATELYPEWGPDREIIQRVDDEAFGRLVHLRVEVQHLIRLPDSGAVMFLIRTYLMPLEVLASIEPWRRRTAKVLAELPSDMADYKGIIKYRDRAAAWLEGHAATPTTPTTPVALEEPIPPQVPSLPALPDEPAAVDESGTSFLVLALGGGPLAAEIARTWTAAAEPLGPTTLGVLDGIDDPDDRATFELLLDRARAGVRVMVVGGQYDVLQTLALLRRHGALESELRAFVTDRSDLPVFCAHCRATFRASTVPGGLTVCPGCERTLEVHEHHAKHLGSFLASDAEATTL